MSTPRLNLRSPRLLLPLLYRALAGRADASQAALTQRRIEHLQAENTELAKQLSELRARVGITQAKADKTRQAATQSGLDLRIFMETYQEPAGGGLFKPRLTLEQKQRQLHKMELESISADAAADAKAAAAQAAAVTAELSKVEAASEQNRSARWQHGSALAEELAADILGRLCEGLERGWQALQASGEAGQSPVGSTGVAQAVAIPLSSQAPLQVARALCLEQLGGLRRSVRGDLMVAVLSVLTELLAPAAGSSGSAGARRALIDVGTILQQHSDPSARLLECFIRWHGGESLGLADIGIATSGSFSLPALHRLYELLRVLAGLAYDEGELERESAPPEHSSTIIMLHEYQRAFQPSENWEPLGAELLAEFARDGDVLQRLLAANLLLQRGEVDRLLEPADAEAAMPDAPRRAGRLATPQPPLLDQLRGDGLHSWPAAAHAGLLSALACHALLAARVQAPAWVYEQWLKESYGWPKDDLYWWTLSTLNQDPALLRNLHKDEGQLFGV